MRDSRTLYMRYTDAQGRQTDRQHQVWDASLFLAAREREARRSAAAGARGSHHPRAVHRGPPARSHGCCVCQGLKP